MNNNSATNLPALDGHAVGGDSGGSRFSFAEFRAILYRQRRFMIPALVAGPLIGLAVTAAMPTIYEGKVSVKINNERTQIFQGQDLDPIVSIADTARYLETQSKLVQSRNLAGTVVDELKLDRNDEFAQQMGEKPVEQNSSGSAKQIARREQAIHLLQAHVAMDVARDNRIAELTFRSSNRALAARVANAYADAYLNLNVLEHFETNAYARKVLAEQVAQTRFKLQETERKAIDYARTNRLIDIGDAASGADHGKDGGKASGGARSITTANLVSINDAYAAAVASRISAQERWNAARMTKATDLPEAQGSATLQFVLQTRATLAAKLAQLRQRYADGRPEIREVAAQLAETDQQIGELSNSVRNALRNQYLAAAQQEAELGKVRKDLASSTLVEQEMRVQLNVIVGNADSLRQQLQDMQKRLDQVSSATDVNTSSVSIVDRASLPEKPVSPNVLANLLFGLLGGVGLAVALAVIRELVDETLWRPEDVEMKLRLPLLGVIPWVSGQVLENLNDEKSDVSEAYNSLRTTVDYFSGSTSSKVLLITSGSPREGKSTTSFALAQKFARTGKKTLLIDMDARVPSMHRFFGTPKNQAGLMECLLQGKSPRELILTTDLDFLHLMPLGMKPANPVQMLSSSRVDDLLAQLRQEFDVIIIDSAPVMGLADAPLLSRLADGVVFVAEAGRAHNGQAKISMRRLRANGASIIGGVITKFNVERYGYEYGYNSYYYYNYKTRYGSESAVESQA